MRSQALAAALVAALVAVSLCIAGCLEDPGRPRLTGIVADPATTHLALAWLPASLAAPTPGEALIVPDDRKFDPAALLADLTEPPPAFTCEEGAGGVALELFRVGGCATPPPEPTGVRLGVARILGFAGPPAFPDTATAPQEASSSVCDDVEVVWTSEPIARSSREWLAFQSELPAGASLVRRVRCPMITDPCATCWPFYDSYHCVEPISDEGLIILRPWAGPTGEPRP